MAWSILGQLKRMDSFDLVEAREVLCVEGQDALHSMNIHGGNQPRIMHLNARDAIVYRQAASFVVNCKRVGKQPELGFNFFSSNIRFNRR